MKTYILAAALFIAVWHASAQTNPPANAAGSRMNPEQTLQALEREWATAVVQRDTNTISRLRSDDFEFTDPNGQIWTKSRTLEFISAGRLQLDSYAMSEFRIRTYGDTAVVNFRVQWFGQADGVDISGPQRMTDVFVRQNDKWRCVASHTTRIQ